MGWSSYSVTKIKTTVHSATRFLKSLNHSGNESAIFAALDGKTVIATLGIYKEDHIKKNHKAVIWGMYVDKNYRRQGLGHRLLDTAIQFAQHNMRVASVALSVEFKNESAKKLYLSKGFKCWGVEPKAINHNGLYLDEDHMVFFFE